MFCVAMSGKALVTPDEYGALVYTIPAEVWTGAALAAAVLSAHGALFRCVRTFGAGAALHLLVCSLFFAMGFEAARVGLLWPLAPVGAYFVGAVPLWQIARARYG